MHTLLALTVVTTGVGYLMVRVGLGKRDAPAPQSLAPVPVVQPSDRRLRLQGLHRQGPLTAFQSARPIANSEEST